MTKSKLAVFFDSIIIALIVFIVSYTWVAKLIKNAFFVFFVCIFISLLLFFVVFLHGLKKHTFLKIKNKELKFFENCLLHLKFCSLIDYISFLEKLLNIKHIQGYMFENKQNYFYINLKSELNTDSFFSANNFFLTHNINKNLHFISSETSESFCNLLSSSPIKFQHHSSNELFEIMKNNNLYPIKNIPANSSKYINLKKYKDKILGVLNKSKFKDFFFSGLSLLLISFFIPYSYYYLFFGTILITLSVICLFRKNKQQINSSTKSLSEIIKK